MEAILLNVYDVIEDVDGRRSEAEGKERDKRGKKSGVVRKHACEEYSQKRHEVLIPLPGTGNLDERVHHKRKNGEVLTDERMDTRSDSGSSIGR
jgi:hypothetical protein